MAPESARRPGPLHALGVLLAVLLAAGHLYLALAVEQVGSTASNQFLAIGAGFLAGAVISYTDYFRPVLYGVGSLYAAVLGVLWLLGGTEYLRLGLAMSVLGTAFLVLTTYLFVRAEAATEA